MATWVSSSGWGAWIADCGPYIGPTTVPFPSNAALGSYGTADEVDYYVTAAPSADVLAATDTDPAAGVDVRWTSPTTTTTDTYNVGTYGSGAHLYVVLYGPGAWPTSMPSMDPLSLVPSTLVAGGTLGGGGAFIWTDCRTDYLAGFACDMGLYRGPWPLLPPGELTGITTGHALFFYVALPNPSGASDPSIVGDGTYDTSVWAAWRSTNPSTPPPATVFGFSGDSTGPSAPFPIPSTMTAGAHLYVVADMTAAPANPPEFYVPATYATGGVSAFETAMGHWSGDQSPFTVTDTVPEIGSGTHYTTSVTKTYAADHSVQSATDAAITDLLASTPTGGTTAPVLDVAKAFTGGGVTTTVQVAVSIIGKFFDGTPFLDSDFPPALNSLVDGQDYASRTPWIAPGGLPVEGWRYNTAPAFTWAAGAADGSYAEFYNAHGGGTGGASIPLGLPIRLQWLPGTSGLASLPLTPSGTLIGDVTPPAEPSSTGSLVPYAVDYSSVNVATFTVVAVPKFLYDGTIAGMTNVTMPGTVQTNGYADDPKITPSTADIVIDRSTWQFWVPGAIIPAPAAVKWHTVGGHWATVGGATMRILTPLPGGDVWVDVADGPG